MGKDHSRADEGPPHEVRIGPFRTSVRPVTNAEYAVFVAATGYEPAPFLVEEKFAAADQPVVGINWFDATAYCDWLSANTGTSFRLPTEAEREFAAHGGLPAGDWPWEGANAEFVEWLNRFDAPHVPSPQCRNGYGLFCMAENVHEWCSDWYSSAYYADSPRDNPRGPSSGVRRASRGGAWRHREKTTRVNARSSLVPEFRYSDFGFRLYADA